MYIVLGNESNYVAIRVTCLHIVMPKNLWTISIKQLHAATRILNLNYVYEKYNVYEKYKFVDRTDRAPTNSKAFTMPSCEKCVNVASQSFSKSCVAAIKKFKSLAYEYK